jgi:hypothetical protein
VVPDVSDSIMPKPRVAELLGEDDWAFAVAEDADVTQIAMKFGAYGWAVSEPDGVIADGEGGLEITYGDGPVPIQEKPDIARYAADGRTGTWCIITAVS